LKFQRGSIFRPEKEFYKFAGIILLIGNILFIMGVNLAEALFPGYSVRSNTLSYLGGSVPLVQPSALIFDASVILVGILSLTAVYLILKSGGCRLFSTCLAISAVGSLGVGLFPQYTGGIHTLFAILIFLFGNLAVIFSYRLGLNIPMIIISMIIGIFSLLIFLSVLILGTGINNPLVVLLGIGGVERLIAYPSLFYLIGLGGYLTCRGKDWVRIRFTEGYW